MRNAQPITVAPIALAILALALAEFATCQAEPIDFVRDVRPIFQEHCYSCHGAEKQKSNLRLDIKSEAFKGGDNYGPSIIANNPSDSPLLQLLTSEDKNERMPPEGAGLSDKQLTTVKQWITEGALWPDGIDLAKLEDRRDHWSFKPITRPQPPQVHQAGWPRSDLDRFILARLEQEGLHPAPEATRTAWLRRVSFDLTGLPPTPEQVAHFASDKRGDAYERVVNDLLNSQRYGERWAQHWLDVVRYADTHGFEVNTERPNAWPYRDYVIEAFNRDTPYNQFLREQIAGDALGQDAATGFLITASVLLPGQIGKDEPSIRLARQDSLDEIVVNIGQTCLALSIGCARCHDHKFDPISASEYYSMQAFVAGVEYADRELRTPEADRQRAQAEGLKTELNEVKQALTQFEPLAHPRTSDTTGDNRAGDGPPSAPLQYEVTFAPQTAKFIRFTIHDANLHPSLGLIEPCIDEFEIFAEGTPSRNIALASEGTKATASGSRISDLHRLEHINDGRYGNSHSWMSDEAGQGWVLFELPEPIRIHRITWSRDREGKFTDRLATAYTLEAGPSLDAMTELASVQPLRSAVTAGVNFERFPTVKTKRLRMRINATNNLEPCIDELEVFNTAASNVALATAGTTVKSSGDNVTSNRHELQFINDGQFGNSRSWMSSEVGKGWVELEFAEEQAIERVAWGRDREGQFADRLAIDYRIEVANAADQWQIVADSSDRQMFGTPDLRRDAASHSLAGLDRAEAEQARRLLAKKTAIEAQIASASAAQMAFAGTFRKPDTIRLLNRGDPEQPREEVGPAVPSVLGELRLPADAPESDRRLALADWIVRPENPLTARVMVNRIWQGHFGMGIVETASDFGRTGTAPSHPELLDWLATEFIRSDWSIKQLHRMIVLSSTYRQSTQFATIAAAQDVDCRWLWRFPPRRLEAETIRDSILAISSRLNLKMLGRGYDLFNQRGGLSGFTPVEVFEGEGLRRMIYAHKVRREREAIFGAFDCPDAGQSTSRRRESTTPIQALNLFNSRFTLDQANALAQRVTAEAGQDVGEQVRRVFTLALNRQPDTSELTECTAVVMQTGLPTLCRVIFNSNEFLFVP
jgi:mono/diheme cytochrome c family protein